MEIIAAFVAGALLGAGSLIAWALCAANTMYEEKLKKAGRPRAAKESTETDVLENDNVFKSFIEGDAGKTY